MRRVLVVVAIWISVGNVITYGMCRVGKQPFTALEVVVGTVAGPIALLPLIIIVAAEGRNLCLANCK